MSSHHPTQLQKLKAYFKNYCKILGLQEEDGKNKDTLIGTQSCMLELTGSRQYESCKNNAECTCNIDRMSYSLLKAMLENQKSKDKESHSKDLLRKDSHESQKKQST